MPKPEHREISGLDMIEAQMGEAFQPYDRLVLRDTKGRKIWTVLASEPADQGWTVTGIRCPPGCQDHRRRR